MNKNDLPRNNQLQEFETNINRLFQVVEYRFKRVRGLVIRYEEPLIVAHGIIGFSEAVNAYIKAYKFFYALRRSCGLTGRNKRIDDEFTAVKRMMEELDRLVDPRTP